MRDITFRYWDKKFKIMSYKAENIHDFKRNKTETWAGMCFGELILLAQDGLFEIMQFTGLFDKNNKPIYEGDIIEWDRKEYALHKTLRGSIVWKEFGWHIKTKPFGSLYFMTINYRCKVIGNVFQNTEFLKVEDKQCKDKH